MRKILSTLGLVFALLLMVASVAAAAPDNSNNADDVVPLECDEPIGDIAVRPVPGESGSSAWNVETGEHYVAKQFSGSDEVTVTITGGDSVTASSEFVEERGASAPANGRSDLVECTTIGEFMDGPFPIDAEFAEILNAEFETDIFEAGQEVTITAEFTLTVLILVPGS